MSLRKRFLASLSGRLIISLSAGIVVALAIWLFVFHLLVRNELYDNFDQSLVMRLESLAAYAVQNPGAEGIAEVLPNHFSCRRARLPSLSVRAEVNTVMPFPPGE